MARHVFSKEETQQGGRKQGLISKIKGLGIFAITTGSPEHLENCRKGGLGSLQGAKNRDSGQWDQIRNSAAAVGGRLAWARSDENKNRVRELGRQNGPSVDFNKIKTPESLSLGGVNSTGRHNRWHLMRKLLNPLCPLCKVAKDRGESWWTAIYIPNPNSNKAGKIRPL